MKSVSIIIPVYNVEGYLPQCLDSVAKQLRDDWEVILVNDGSTDGSGRLCEEFAVGKDNVRVVNKLNGGLSDARNAGTEVANGDWIYYLDSDDWLVEGAIQKLYDFAIENKCEVVQGGLYYAYSDHLLYRNPTKAEIENTLLDNNEAMHQLILNDRVKNFAWGKLYRADLIRDLKFPVGKYFEDSYWQHLVMHRVTRYGIIDEPLYYYRQRETSISGEFSARNLDLLKGYKERLFFVDRFYPQYSGEMKALYRRLCVHFNENATIYLSPDEQEIFKEFLNKENITYNRILYKACTFIKRVWNHFFFKSFKRVDNN